MKTKNQLIIEAFQKLDSQMLDILLDENQAYQEVSKDTFVNRMHEYFNELRADQSVNCQLKAVPGECNLCNKGEKGFAFVNEDNTALMELLFEEKDGKIIDICPCSSFSAEENYEYRHYPSFFFFEEDKVDFKPSFHHYQHVAAVERGIKEIESEISNEGILSAEFCLSWFDTYSLFDGIDSLFTNKSYKFKEPIQKYITGLRFYVEMLKRNDIAKQYLDELNSVAVLNSVFLTDWLIRYDREFEYYKFGFDITADYLSQTCQERDFIFDLKPIYYTQNLGYLLSYYSNLIPDSKTADEKSDSGLYWADDEDLPF